MYRINTLCFVAVTAASITSAAAGDLAGFRRDIERQLGPDFIRELPGAQPTKPAHAQTIQPPCAPCEQTTREAYELQQARLRAQYDAHERSDRQVHDHRADLPAPQMRLERTPAQSPPVKPDRLASYPSTQGNDSALDEPYYSAQINSAPPVHNNASPGVPVRTRSGAQIAPYDTTPATPQLEHSSPTLSLMPNVGTKQSTGRQVWAVIDGDEEFASAPASPYAVGANMHHGLPVSVRVSPYGSAEQDAPVTAGAAGGDMDEFPMGIVQPSLYPPADAFGNPALDLRLAASIPSNALTAAKIDPDRLMLTPVAYHTEGSSLQEILRSLVPSSYRVSYDVEPGVLDKVYRVTLEQSLADALQSVESMANVHIKAYHQLQVLLVTEHKDALK